jgi:hypothetical protein
MKVSNALILVLLNTIPSISAAQFGKILRVKRAEWCSNLGERDIADEIEHVDVSNSNVINKVRIA